MLVVRGHCISHLALELKNCKNVCNSIVSLNSLKKKLLKLHCSAVTRIRTGVAATTTQSTNHYTITAGFKSWLCKAYIGCESDVDKLAKLFSFWSR